MRNEPEIDATDARILAALDADPAATTLGLSRTLGIARNTVHARLKRLEASGALAAPSRRVRAEALGYPIVAFVEIAISQATLRHSYETIIDIPEIVEVHATTGNADLLAKIVARDTADLHRITNRLFDIEGVQRTNTSVSLDEVVAFRIAPLLERVAEGAP